MGQRKTAGKGSVELDWLMSKLPGYCELPDGSGATYAREQTEEFLKLFSDKRREEKGEEYSLEQDRTTVTRWFKNNKPAFMKRAGLSAEKPQPIKLVQPKAMSAQQLYAQDLLALDTDDLKAKVEDRRTEEGLSNKHDIGIRTKIIHEGFASLGDDEKSDYQRKAEEKKKESRVGSSKPVVVASEGEYGSLEATADKWLRQMQQHFPLFTFHVQAGGPVIEDGKVQTTYYSSSSGSLEKVPYHKWADAKFPEAKLPFQDFLRLRRQANQVAIDEATGTVRDSASPGPAVVGDIAVHAPESSENQDDHAISTTRNDQDANHSAVDLNDSTDMGPQSPPSDEPMPVELQGTSAELQDSARTVTSGLEEGTSTTVPALSSAASSQTGELKPAEKEKEKSPSPETEASDKENESGGASLQAESQDQRGSQGPESTTSATAGTTQSADPVGEGSTPSGSSSPNKKRRRKPLVEGYYRNLHTGGTNAKQKGTEGGDDEGDNRPANKRRKVSRGGKAVGNPRRKTTSPKPLGLRAAEEHAVFRGVLTLLDLWGAFGRS